MNIDNNLLPAIIGVVGTLSGVILGTFLNRFFSSGKLKVFITQYNNSFIENTGYGGIKKTTEITAMTMYARIIIDLEIYNSASDHKILRDIYLIEQYNKELFKYPLKDMTRKSSGLFEVISISPKTIYKVNLLTTIDKDLDKIKSSKFYLHYKNHNEREFNLELIEKDLPYAGMAIFQD